MDDKPHDHAVLVNPLADRMSDELVTRINELVPPDDVYVCSDDERYDALVERLLAQGYGTIFTAGGDGTVHRLINHLPPPERGAPRIGILPCGAGNGLAGLVTGDGGDPLGDLRTWVMNPSADTLRLGLCEAEGVRFANAGLGLDAAAMRDFQTLLRRFGKGPLHRALHGRGGYVTAIFGMTLPKRLFRGTVEVTVTNLGAANAASQGDDGVTLGEAFGPGEVLYEGPVNTTLMGTAPTFGHRYKLLPMAGVEPGRFHLRLSNVAPMRLLAGLRALRRGTFEHERLHDFLAERVHLAFSEPVSYQVAGELMGERQELVVGVSPGAVELVRFL